ncbi:hypothetical protein JCM8097_000347 [Rhodosporidiobolus ruineniae]
MKLGLATLAALLPALALAIPVSLDLARTDLEADSTAPAQSPRILILRHGEKPPRPGVGLNCVGKKRAQCLRKLLSRDNGYNLGLILSQSYNAKTSHRKRSYDTVVPLAEDCGLEIDHECYKYDAECAAGKVKRYLEEGGKGDVVLSWKASTIGPIARLLGVEDPPHYPRNRYDIIWTIQDGKLISKSPEDCPSIPAFPPGGPRGPSGPGGPHGPHPPPGDDDGRGGPPWRRPPPEMDGEKGREGEKREEEERGRSGEELEDEDEEECDVEEYYDSLGDWPNEEVEGYGWEREEQIVLGV